MSASKPLAAELAFEAMTYDIDYAGIVSNIVYIRWLEDLRLKILAENCPLDEQLAENVSPVLDKTEIHYRRPLRLFDKPQGLMWVHQLSGARWEVRAEFHLEQRLIAEAVQTGYFVDLTRLRPVAVPQALQDKWQAVQQEA